MMKKNPIMPSYAKTLSIFFSPNQPSFISYFLNKYYPNLPKTTHYGSEVDLVKKLAVCLRLSVFFLVGVGG